MDSNVAVQGARLAELFATHRTLERLFAGVNLQMVRKGSRLTKGFAAVRAGVRLFTSVDFYMIR